MIEVQSCVQHLLLETIAHPNWTLLLKTGLEQHRSCQRAHPSKFAKYQQITQMGTSTTIVMVQKNQVTSNMIDNEATNIFNSILDIQTGMISGSHSLESFPAIRILLVCSTRGNCASKKIWFIVWMKATPTMPVGSYTIGWVESVHEAPCSSLFLTYTWINQPTIVNHRKTINCLPSDQTCYPPHMERA